jgi:Zn-dependent protease with chaperone function
MSGVVLFCGLSLVISAWIVELVSGDRVLRIFYDVQQGVRFGSKRMRIILFPSIIVCSYLLFGLLGFMIYRSVSSQYGLLHVMLFAAASLSSAYFIFGILYQTVHGFWEKIKLLIYSSKSNLNHKYEFTVLTVDGGQRSPLALSTGVNRYVFIPSKIEDNLSESELEAIIAHENKHLQTYEAFVSFIMPLLSLLLLTGQNAIYALFDFHKREIEADRHAAQQVGSTELINALNKTSEIYNFSNTDSVTWWQDKFGMFYGTFARSEVHPSLNERISHLQEMKN